MDIEYLKKNIDRNWGYRVAEELRVQNLKNRTQEEWLEVLPYVHFVSEPTGYLLHAAADLQKVLYEAGITFCFIGGVSLQCWGEVRHTEDVDITIYCDLGDESNVVEVLNGYLESRVEDARNMFMLGRMFLGISPEGKPIDISIRNTPYERRMMDRAVEIDYGLEVPLRICSAPDLTIMKTIAGRLRDWADLERIIQRSGQSMDWDLVYSELQPLLAMAGREENLGRLQKMVAAEFPAE